MPTLLGLSFISGLATILAPCIWPLLPIIFSASSGTGRQRPLGLALGVVSSFTLLTLSISYIEKVIPVDPNLLRTAAVIVIIALGLIMIFPGLSARVEGFVSRIIGPRHQGKGSEKNGFYAGYWTGFSIGLVWAPCAGPILAAVATLAALQALNAQIIAVALAYAAGLSIPLFLFALGGSAFFGRLRRFNKYTGRIQQAFGVIMLVSAALIYTNYDKVLQVKILDAFPGYTRFINQLEQPGTSASIDQLLPGRPAMTLARAEQDKLPDLGPAPELSGITHWLNTSEPLSMAALKGKVVLIDFWTYSCINCIRTLPHVIAWYEKFKDKGFVVIGVHAPEFAFEKDTANVSRAIQQFNIPYPVAQDNNFITWQAYNNHYWPAEYLIDANGRIRRAHFGEGGYPETEHAILSLLQEAGQSLQASADNTADDTPHEKRTPETYLGLARMERFSSPEQPQKGLQFFTPPAVLDRDHLSYEGIWILAQESAHPRKGAILSLRFEADKVFLVAGTAEQRSLVRVKLDGKLIADELAGRDVHDATVVIDQERLYELVDLKGTPGEHVLQLKFDDNNTAIYAFTFG